MKRIEQSKANPYKNTILSCQFCANRISQFPICMSKKNQDPSTSISNLHETLNSKQSTSQAIEKLQQELKSSVSYDRQPKNYMNNCPIEQKRTRKDEIFQLNICFNCLTQLRKFNTNLSKTQEYIGKENELISQQPNKVIAKSQKKNENSQQPDQINDYIDEKVDQNRLQKSKQALNKISEESIGSNLLSQLILQDHQFFKNHKTGSIKNQEHSHNFSGESCCLGLNSYRIQQQQKMQLHSLDGGLLGMNSVIEQSHDQKLRYHSKACLDKKIILEGFPRERMHCKKVNNRSIETLIEKQKININQDEEYLAVCFICNYEVENINSFSVESAKNSKHSDKRICRLCHTLNESQNPLISFQGRDRIKTTKMQYSRSKRAETLAKLPTYLRDRIATTHNRFQSPTSQEKRQSHSRKRMIPRQNMNKKNGQKKNGCELCFKIGLTLIKKGGQYLCANCFYVNRNAI